MFRPPVPTNLEKLKQLGKLQINLERLNPAMTLANEVATAFQASLGVPGGLGVDLAIVAWTRLTFELTRRSTPLLGTHIRRPQALIAHIACSFFAHWK